VSIHDLLERLERGVARRAPLPVAAAVPANSARPVPPVSVSAESIEHTLDVLRQLGSRAG
jgi:hypothetical protein